MVKESPVVAWDAQEYVVRSKNTGWYVGLIFVGLLLVALSVWLRWWTFTALIVLSVLSLMPLERDFVRGVYVLCCVPVGNLVLSFAEMLGEGQDVAANVVLLSTILSMVTIPLMLLIV